MAFDAAITDAGLDESRFPKDLSPFIPIGAIDCITVFENVLAEGAFLLATVCTGIFRDGLFVAAFFLLPVGCFFDDLERAGIC